jgi:hypothetical protein
VAVAGLALGLQERQPLEREERPDHVFSHPLGLDLCLGPDQAVDVETGVRPGENPLEVRVEIDPVPKSLDGGDDARDELFLRQIQNAIKDFPCVD